MVLKGIANALGFVPKEEIESSLSKHNSEFEQYKSSKEAEIVRLQEQINRLETENAANVETLKKLAADIENVSKQYAQTQEDFRISEENSKKTQEIIAENEKNLEKENDVLERDKEGLEKKCRALQKGVELAKDALISLQKKVAGFERENKKLEQKHQKLQKTLAPKAKKKN